MPTLNDSRLEVAFSQISGLKWQPWVGLDFLDRPLDQRLLIIGESHYYTGKTSEALEGNRLGYESPSSTVEMVQAWGWRTKTWNNIPWLFFGRGTIDETLLLRNIAYYNFVQRPMNKNVNERPKKMDFVNGWKSFANVVQVLRPSHCLFIGVTGFKSFDSSMSEIGQEYTSAIFPEKVGRTYARTATVQFDSETIELVGVQHLGKFFSWSNWRSYLLGNHPVLMRAFE